MVEIPTRTGSRLCSKQLSGDDLLQGDNDKRLWTANSHSGLPFVPDSLISTMPLKMAIVVHGRFHAFDLSRELIQQGVDLILLTNYPKHVVQRFGIPRRNVVNCVSHGVLSRLVNHTAGRRGRAVFEPFLHRWFSRWAVHVLSSVDVDVIHTFSGVSEELLRAFCSDRCLLTLVRGSAHIRTQAQLLEDEEIRCGQPMDRPSSWMIAREEREYNLADLVIVLSSFARRTFVERGTPPERMRMLPLGSEIGRFGASKDDVERRCARILTGGPLRILTVGRFSFQKGALDICEIVRRLKGRMKFRFVGDVPVECRRLRGLMGDAIEFLPRQSQFSLPSIYRDGDLFLFPTIQDGYPVVLAQAQAGGLPILATANCSAPDILQENENGWVLPIRNPAAFVSRLEWCDSHRPELARMVRTTYESCQPRDWSQVASDLISISEEWFASHRVPPSTATFMQA